MAPKFRKGRKALKVLKRPAAPSAIKGLAGFRKASATFNGAVDKGVSQQNAALASRTAVLAGLDARLVCIDAATNSDRYYVLQGLEDTKIPEGKAKRCYAYQRWGRTGTGGVCRLQGPMEQKKVEMHLFKVFKAKTDAAWGSLKAGEKAKPGKYWLAVPSEADPRANWEYYVDDSVDGKCKGWYPYENGAIQQVEELYAEHAANKSGKNATDKRFVTSGKFTYCLDLGSLSQRNARTGKVRRIRRSLSAASGSRLSAASGRPQPGSSPVSSSSDAFLGFFEADMADTLPVSWSDACGNAKRALANASPLASSSSVSSIPGLPGKRPRHSSPAPTGVNDMRKLADSGEVEQLSIPVLKAWLSSRSIASSGSKAVLAERVYALLDDVE